MKSPADSNTHSLAVLEATLVHVLDMLTSAPSLSLGVAAYCGAA